MMARVARENDDGSGVMLCIAECILSCLASIMEYFNKVRVVLIVSLGWILLLKVVGSDICFSICCSGLSSMSVSMATLTLRPERTSLRYSETEVGRPSLPMIWYPIRYF